MRSRQSSTNAPDMLQQRNPMLSLLEVSSSGLGRTAKTASSCSEGHKEEGRSARCVSPGKEHMADLRQDFG